MNASDVESRAVSYLEREVGWGGIQKAGIYGDVEGSLHTGLFLGSWQWWEQLDRATSVVFYWPISFPFFQFVAINNWLFWLQLEANLESLLKL